MLCSSDIDGNYAKQIYKLLNDFIQNWEPMPLH